MQRREFLGALGAWSSLPWAHWVLGDESTSKPWKTAVGLNGFASSAGKYNKSYKLEEILKFAAETGFDGVELVQRWPWADYPAANDRPRIQKTRTQYERAGIQVFSIQTGAGGAFAPDRDARKRWLEEFEDRARFAKAVGAECIGMWPGGPLRDQTIDQAIDHLGDSFREAAIIAQNLGMTAAFEIEPPFVFNTEEHLTRILKRADCPDLNTIYDPSHFDLMNASLGRPHEMLERVGVENIGYIHLTDTDGTLRDGGTSKHLACGDGHANIAKSLDVLYQGGFRGWVMIDGWQIPDVYDACVKGKRAIDAALARARPS